MQVVPLGGQTTTNASGAIWWPNLQLLNASGAMSLPNLVKESISGSVVLLAMFTANFEIQNCPCATSSDAKWQRMFQVWVANQGNVGGGY